jgi:hypothetical protein
MMISATRRSFGLINGTSLFVLKLGVSYSLAAELQTSASLIDAHRPRAEADRVRAATARPSLFGEDEES